ncbi:MAG: hypothetical protein JNL52_05365 [Flavobacteriales bacterium]|nr:hypothetical protein [Flavobacteriales bacterium]
MRSTLLLFPLMVPVTLAAQQQVFFEDFEAPLPAFAPNTPDMGSVTSGDNTWLINNAYAGGSGTITCLGFPFSFTVPATQAQPGGITNPNGRYLHTTSTAAIASGVQNCCFVAADGLCAQPANHFARMTQDVSTVGSTSATLTFWWICGGGTSNYGEVYYSTNSGTTWNLISTPIAQYRNQTSWTQQTITLPELGGQSTLRFGFRFVNGTTLSAQDPGFGIDDVRITVPTVGTNTIATGDLATTVLCQGASIGMPYTVAGAWGSGNVFTLQLSDASGSFAAPVAIGTLLSNASGIITGIIPANTPPGAGYRLRVVGSDPQTVGAVGGLTYAVLAAPSAGIDATASLCKNTGTYDLLAFLGGTPADCGSWTGPNGAVPSGVFNTATDVGGQYVFTTACPGGCPQDEAVLLISLFDPANAGNNVTAAECEDNVPATLYGYVSGGSLSGIFFLNDQPVTNTILQDAGVYPLQYVVYGTGPCANDTAAISITVNAAPNVGASTTHTVCVNGASIDLLSLLVGADEGGTWTAPGGGPFDGTLVPSTSASGLYTYTIEGVAPCTDAQSFVAVVIDPCTGIGDVEERSLIQWGGQHGEGHLLIIPDDHRVVDVIAPNGSRVAQWQSTNVQGRQWLHLGEQASGAYSIRLMGPDGVRVLRLMHVAQ